MVSWEVHAVETASTPKQLVFPERKLREFERGTSDDPDYRSSYSVEHHLHPGQPAVANVGRREPQHHQEGWQDERHAHGGSTEHTSANVA
jgi:hypothetical protein